MRVHSDRMSDFVLKEQLWISTQLYRGTFILCEGRRESVLVTYKGLTYLVVATAGIERVGSTRKEGFVITWHQHFDVVVTLILWEAKHWLLLTPASHADTDTESSSSHFNTHTQDYHHLYSKMQDVTRQQFLKQTNYNIIGCLLSKDRPLQKVVIVFAIFLNWIQCSLRLEVYKGGTIYRNISISWMCISHITLVWKNEMPSMFKLHQSFRSVQIAKRLACHALCPSEDDQQSEIMGNRYVGFIIFSLECFNKVQIDITNLKKSTFLYLSLLCKRVIPYKLKSVDLFICMLYKYILLTNTALLTINCWLFVKESEIKGLFTHAVFPPDCAFLHILCLPCQFLPHKQTQSWTCPYSQQLQWENLIYFNKHHR